MIKEFLPSYENLAEADLIMEQICLTLYKKVKQKLDGISQVFLSDVRITIKAPRSVHVSKLTRNGWSEFKHDQMASNFAKFRTACLRAR